MADFNIRTDAVDVEQIMRQIRARIQSKRGVDYTEEQIQELANVKLERFLDPKGVRSDLVEQFRRARDRKLEPFQPEQYTASTPTMLYGSASRHHPAVPQAAEPDSEAASSIRTRSSRCCTSRRASTRSTKQQFHLLREKSQQRDEVDVLYYELVHNLVLELTRVGIENRNLKMRLESLSSRMDFDERRARALESVVQYRPGTGPSREPQQTRARPPQDDRQHQQPRPAPTACAGAAPQAQRSRAGRVPSPTDPASESNTARRRRRRRRGRRGGRGRTPGEGMAADGTPTELASSEDSPTPPHGDPTADAALAEGPDTDFDDGPAEAGSDRDDSGEEPDPSAQ